MVTSVLIVSAPPQRPISDNGVTCHWKALIDKIIKFESDSRYSTSSSSTIIKKLKKVRRLPYLSKKNDKLALREQGDILRIERDCKARGMGSSSNRHHPGDTGRNQEPRRPNDNLNRPNAAPASQNEIAAAKDRLKDYLLENYIGPRGNKQDAVEGAVRTMTGGWAGVSVSKTYDGYPWHHDSVTPKRILKGWSSYWNGCDRTKNIFKKPRRRLLTARLAKHEDDWSRG